MGKLEAEEYAKAKVRLDKKNALLSKTAAKLGPKKRAVAKAKATAKARVVSKAKVKQVRAKVKAVPRGGKAKCVAVVKKVAAPKKPRGVVAKVTGATKKRPLPAAKKTKKTIIKVCTCDCLPV